MHAVVAVGRCFVGVCLELKMSVSLCLRQLSVGVVVISAAVAVCAELVVCDVVVCYCQGDVVVLCGGAVYVASS